MKMFSMFDAWSGFLAQGDGELRFAAGGGLVEGFGGAIAFGGLKKEAMLNAVGESGEAGFTVYVGADLEVKLAGIHESVSNMNLDFRGVDGSAGGVGNGEVGGAGADSAVDDRHRFRIRLPRSRLGRGWDG